MEVWGAEGSRLQVLRTYASGADEHPYGGCSWLQSHAHQHQHRAYEQCESPSQVIRREGSEREALYNCKLAPVHQH